MSEPKPILKRYLSFAVLGLIAAPIALLLSGLLIALPFGIMAMDLAVSERTNIGLLISSSAMSLLLAAPFKAGVMAIAATWLPNLVILPIAAATIRLRHMASPFYATTGGIAGHLGALLQQPLSTSIQLPTVITVVSGVISGLIFAPFAKSPRMRTPALQEGTR